MLRYVAVLLMAFLFLFASPLRAADEDAARSEDDSQLATCPACPTGCIPADLVEEYAFDPQKYEETCPAGCADIRLVRSISGDPTCLLEPLKLRAGLTEEESTEGEGGFHYSHTLNRIVTSRTALPLEEHKFSASGYMIGLWELNGSPYKNLQVGIFTLVPASFFAFVPTLHYSIQITDNAYIGAGIFGGYFSNFIIIDPIEVWALGSSVEYTYVYDRRHVFNVMLTGLGGGHDEDDNGIVNWPFGIMVPSLAYQYRWSKDWAFNLDLSVPLIIDDHIEETNRDIEEMFTFNIFYGVRGHGGIIFGDIGFYLPASKWFKRYLWRYLPLGFPYFSVGVEI